MQLVLETERKLLARYHVKSIVDVPDNDPDLIDMQEYMNRNEDGRTKRKSDRTYVGKPRGVSRETLEKVEFLKDYFDEGMTVSEVAEELDMNVNSLKGQILYYQKKGIWG